MPAMTATIAAPATDYSMNAEQIAAFKEHTGFWNIGATSGGRIINTPEGLVLPVRYGYKVRVRLESDLYTVQRLHVRGDKTTVKGERAFVFAEQVGEAVYRAGCYHDEF